MWRITIVLRIKARSSAAESRNAKIAIPLLKARISAAKRIPVYAGKDASQKWNDEVIIRVKEIHTFQNSEGINGKPVSYNQFSWFQIAKFQIERLKS